MHTTAEGSPTLPDATGAVMVWDILLYAVEVAVLASRMAVALESPTVSIRVSLHHIAGRELVSGEFGRELHRRSVFSGDAMSAVSTVSATELVANPRGIGVRLTQQLLGQFGADIPDQVLEDWQQEVLKDRYR